jgi:uncharacterized membrane protein
MSPARTALGAFFIGAGLMHFARPRWYRAIMPRSLPAHRELVAASGVAEIAGGVLVLPERTARLAGWWLIATLIAVFPANVSMALRSHDFPRFPPAALWARLPVQGVFIAWVWRVCRLRLRPRWR